MKRGRAPNRDNTKSVYVAPTDKNEAHVFITTSEKKEKSFVDYVVKEIGDVDDILMLNGQHKHWNLKASDLAGFSIHGNFVYFWFNDNSRVFYMNRETSTYSGSFVFKYKDHGVYPYKVRASADFIYVSGYYEPETSCRQYLLLKYDYSGKIQMVSKKYDFAKFADFALDSKEELLLLNPQVNAESDVVSQVCKLKNDFSKKVFYFSMSHEDARYIPEFIESDGPGQRSWVSLRKVPFNAEPGDESAISHRLLSFHSSSYFLDHPENRPTMTAQEKVEAYQNAVKKESWNLQPLSPGQIAAIDDRLMVLDKYKRNLVEVTWNQKEQRPNYRIISAVDKPRYRYLCSDKQSKLYLVTDDGTLHLFQYKKLDTIEEMED